MTPRIPASPPARQYVGGKLGNASSGLSYPILNPATGQEIGRAPDSTPADVDAAIAAARRAFDETDWSTDLELRVRVPAPAPPGTGRHTASELRALTVAEAGAPVVLTPGRSSTPRRGARRGPPTWPSATSGRPTSAIASRWASRRAARPPRGRRRRRGHHAVELPDPDQPGQGRPRPRRRQHRRAQARADTPWLAAELGRLVAEETDIPPGCSTWSPSSRHAVGGSCCRGPAGRPGLVHRLDRHRPRGHGRGRADLKRVFLELGGKSAVDRARRRRPRRGPCDAAFTGVTHAGQGCALTTRLLVPRSRTTRRSSVAADAGQLPVGDPTDPATICGPLISAAPARPGRGLPPPRRRGGRPSPPAAAVPSGPATAGFCVEPTVIAGVDNRRGWPRRRSSARCSSSRPRRRRRRGPHRQRLALRAVGRGGQRTDRARPGRGRADPHRHDQRQRRRLVRRPTCPSAATSSRGIGREMGVAGFEEYLEIKTVAEPA